MSPVGGLMASDQQSESWEWGVVKGVSGGYIEPSGQTTGFRAWPFQVLTVWPLP